MSGLEQKDRQRNCWHHKGGMLPEQHIALRELRARSQVQDRFPHWEFVTLSECKISFNSIKRYLYFSLTWPVLGGLMHPSPCSSQIVWQLKSSYQLVLAGPTSSHFLKLASFPSFGIPSPKATNSVLHVLCLSEVQVCLAQHLQFLGIRFFQALVNYPSFHLLSCPFKGRMHPMLPSSSVCLFLWT